MCNQLTALSKNLPDATIQEKSMPQEVLANKKYLFHIYNPLEKKW